MEQEALGPLNPIRYQMKKHIVTTVDKYGYARLHEDIHYYSVPHTYIGKKVQLSYTATDVEIRVGRHNPDRFMRESYLRLSHKTGTKDLQKNVV